MKVIVKVTENFKINLKPIAKKYPSIFNDLKKLEDELIANPKLGIALGSNVYKIRLKIKSKGKGKSGGARVITLLEEDIILDTYTLENNVTMIILISIYDKSEVANISDKELKDLIKLYKNK